MLKTIFDFIFAVGSLILLAPFFLIIAILIKVDSKGPVFFKQLRVGRDCRLFAVYKFRSMVSGAEKQGPQVTGPRDPRITQMGYWLRKTRLDELPQLLNVLKGEMSVVGPRPEVPGLAERYSEQQKKIFIVKSGLTSPGTLYYILHQADDHPEGVDVEDYYLKKQLPKKLKYDFEYLERRSLWKDLVIIGQTVSIIMGLRKKL